MKNTTTRGRAPRGYSRDFTPHGDTGKRYLLDKIPAGLWRRVRDKATREGISLRALILDLLTQYVDGPRCELCGEPAGDGGALCPACMVGR